MVTSFYIMKMNEKTISMEDYYSGLLRMQLPVFSKHLNHLTKCRACLQDGDIPITNVINYNEMREALLIFGNIEIADDDDVNPTYLCTVCYKLLMSTILFRKVAHRSNVTLGQPLKESPGDHDDSEYNVTFEEKPNPIYVTQTFEYNKEPQDSAKVQCPLCKQILKNSYYKKHLEHHNPHLREPFVCDICGKSFKVNSFYQRHRERHETRYLFKCQLCPYVGRYKERLSMHMRIHTGELKYLCTQCPARYINRGTLSDHIKLKHTEPQYKCESCDKAFYSNLNLQRHVDVAHLGIKNHECNICGKTFGYRVKMLAHQRKIHKTYVRPNVVRVKKPMNSNNSE